MLKYITHDKMINMIKYITQIIPKINVLLLNTDVLYYKNNKPLMKISVTNDFYFYQYSH